MGNDDIDVWLGLDGGKQSHHACALDRHGKRIVDKPLGQDEAQIRELLACLGGHGNVLLVVDQPNTIGSLPLAVARDMGVAVGYLPGSAMRKAAQLLPGDAKTDARDAYVIAFTALHMPDTLRDAGSDDETMARLKVLAGFDDDLAFECNRQINRLRSLLLQIHPAFERALKGDRITRDTTLALLEHYGGPTGMRRSGRTRVGKWAKSAGLRRCDGIIDDLFDAIGQQNVTVAGTQAVEEIVPVLASRIRQLREQREQLAAKVETLLEDHPLLTVLTSMPANRGQDRKPDPAGHLRRHHPVQQRRPPGRLRGHRARHQEKRHQHTWRAPRTGRQQTPQERPMADLLHRRVPRSRKPRLLPTQTQRRQTPQRSHHLLGSPTLQRHLQHAQERNPLPAHAPHGLNRQPPPAGRSMP